MKKIYLKILLGFLLLNVVSIGVFVLIFFLWNRVPASCSPEVTGEQQIETEEQENIKLFVHNWLKVYGEKESHLPAFYIKDTDDYNSLMSFMESKDKMELEILEEDYEKMNDALVIVKLDLAVIKGENTEQGKTELTLKKYKDSTWKILSVITKPEGLLKNSIKEVAAETLTADTEALEENAIPSPSPDEAEEPDGDYYNGPEGASPDMNFGAPENGSEGSEHSSEIADSIKPHIVEDFLYPLNKSWNGLFQ